MISSRHIREGFLKSKPRTSSTPNQEEGIFMSGTCPQIPLGTSFPAISTANVSATNAVSITAMKPVVNRATGKYPFVNADCTVKYRDTPRACNDMTVRTTEMIK